MCRTTRRPGALTLAVAILLVVVPSALAISHGVPDTQHPNTGAMLLEPDPVNAPGELVTWCSGALISAQHFITAGHCVEYLDLLPEVGPENVFVTFD